MGHDSIQPVLLVACQPGVLLNEQDDGRTPRHEIFAPDMTQRYPTEIMACFVSAYVSFYVLLEGDSGYWFVEVLD